MHVHGVQYLHLYLETDADMIMVPSLEGFDSTPGEGTRSVPSGDPFVD